MNNFTITDLIYFCKQNSIRYGGKKILITKRIIDFLQITKKKESNLSLICK